MNDSFDSDAKKARRVQDQTSSHKATIGYDEPTTHDAFIGSQINYGLSHQSQHHELPKQKQRTLTLYNHLSYLLYVLSYFTAGLLWIVPIIMNYAKRHDADGTWLATHFDWQIKTFWYSIVGFVIGALLIIFALGGLAVGVTASINNIAIGGILLAALGLLIIVFTLFWHLYRIVRGWIALTDNRPVP